MVLCEMAGMIGKLTKVLDAELDKTNFLYMLSTYFKVSRDFSFVLHNKGLDVIV